MKNISLRPFADSDIPLFTEWLNKPYIQKWYDPIDEWIEEVKNCDSTFSWISHFIVMCKDVPIGFCQYYDCFDSQNFEDWNGRKFENRGEIYSIDYLIGNEKFLGKGYGKELIRLLTDMVFELGAKEIIVDPDKENASSNGVLLANGYHFCEEYEFYKKYSFLNL
ncbi:MAG: GNAT family N-acetyltransferase [Oscillospiraceae bacterium]|jgi:RimJ/RimL family protein N-acetyltransferase|nr:GNAT family N-acetyltransferase [Oscillospiraceae bacterium]